MTKPKKVARRIGQVAPVSASIDPVKHIVTLRFMGDTSYADWEAVMDAVLANVEYVVGMCVVSDRRDAENVPSSRHIHDLVGYLI